MIGARMPQMPCSHSGRGVSMKLRSWGLRPVDTKCGGTLLVVFQLHICTELVRVGHSRR